MAEPTLQTVAFPTLTGPQIADLARCAAAVPRRCEDGETLVRVGERDFPFFIVKSGAIEAVDYSGEEPRTISVLHTGEFTGEVSHLTGSPAVASLVARGDTEVYVVSRDALREVLNQCPTLSDIILQAFIARRQLLRESPDFTGLRVIGSRYSQDTFRVRDFLTRNRVLFTWVDVESDPHVDQVLKEFGLSEGDTPVVACGHMVLMRNPTNRELADAVGIRRPLGHTVYDLVIAGAGPAGLAAAVYGASEGLRTLVLDSAAPGGQAGSSMRIENYLGFPTGLTGAELTDRAILQANKFGARLSVPSPITRLELDDGYPILHLDGGETVSGRCLLVASGAAYRRLNVEGCARFEGAGVYYAATPSEGQLCEGADVIVVGGGNSAGQAVVFLAQHARKVYVLLRGGDLGKSMSAYLVHRIQQTPNVEVLTNTTIRQMVGDGHLTGVEIVNGITGEDRSLATPAVFSFIGAVPRTDWLPAEVERDAQGFVRTGPDLEGPARGAARRHPFFLETSRPGVFAAGDVRSGSVKRVAAAVGEGAMAVQFVHAYLAER